MSMQERKTDTVSCMHTHRFVSERGGAEEDDLHTQTGVNAMDIRRYFRQRNVKCCGVFSRTLWRAYNRSSSIVHLNSPTNIVVDDIALSWVNIPK